MDTVACLFMGPDSGPATSDIFSQYCGLFTTFVVLAEKLQNYFTIKNAFQNKTVNKNSKSQSKSLGFKALMLSFTSE